jgi:DNA mismatch repair ATPase MutS
MMSAAKTNAKKILDRVKKARSQLEILLKDRTWIDEAKKVAEKQGKEVKKIIDSDVAKLRGFLEKERSELEKLQAQIPGEVARIKKFVSGQKKELSKLLTTVKKRANQKKAPGGAKKRPAKKAGAKRKSSSSGSASASR